MEAHTEEGLTLATIWHGPGLPFAGSLIMVTLDVLLYMLIAYYLDSVLPSKSTFFFIDGSLFILTIRAMLVLSGDRNRLFVMNLAGWAEYFD